MHLVGRSESNTPEMRTHKGRDRSVCLSWENNRVGRISALQLVEKCVSFLASRYAKRVGTFHITDVQAQSA